jgi:hypothetical protein
MWIAVSVLNPLMAILAVSIAGGSAEVMKGVKTAEASAEELRRNVSNFVIEE